MFDPRVVPKHGVSLDALKRAWCSENVNIALEAYRDGTPLIDKPFITGAPELRKPKIQWSWSEWELKEAEKCRNSIMYFAETYCKILHPDQTFKVPKLFPYQKKILETYQRERFVIILASRQMGKTVTTGICLLWDLIFGEGIRVALLGDKTATAYENIQKIKEIYAGLPFFLKPGVTTWNKGSVAFDNGNFVFGGPCNLATIVGRTISHLYFDELAIPDAHVSSAVVEFAFPTISSLDNSKIICSSSPRGDNIFKELWLGAVAGTNPFTPIRIDWWEKPGRDEAWKQMQIGLLGSERAFNQQYGNQFLSGDSNWLDAEVAERIQRTVNSDVWSKVDNFVDEKTYTMLKRVEDIIWRSKYKDDLMELPRKRLVEQCWFDKEFFDGKQLSEVPMTIIIDTGEGKRADHTIVNFFTPVVDTEFAKQLEDNMPDFDNMDDDYVDDNDDMDVFTDATEDDLDQEFFIMNNVRMQQVGLIDSNEHKPIMIALFLQMLVRTGAINEDKIKIVCERDGIGSAMQLALSSDIIKNSGLALNTMGSVDNKTHGIYMRGNKKAIHVDKAETIFNEARIIIKHPVTAYELNKFGKVGRAWAGINAHDDHAMTCVMLGSYMQSEDFFTFVEATMDDDDDTEDSIF